MILRAKQVLPMKAPPIEDGAVVVEGDAIVAVGPAKEISATNTGEVRDLGEVVLLPGLINAHCHLDYTDMVGEVAWNGNFMEWILQLVAAKTLHSDKQFVAAISHGLSQLARSGTTSVVNIESFPVLLNEIPPPSIRVWWCLELIDFSRKEAPREVVEAALKFIREHADNSGQFTLSPHAPYTASAELYRLCGDAARALRVPLTTHVAESAEEEDMFRRGIGPMFDYFRRAGRDMSDCKRVGVVQLLDELGVLGPNCIAAHCNKLTPPEIIQLQRSGTHVVHCPNSHRFFARGTPLLSALWEKQVNVCLGTDSMSSNSTGAELSMFSEMQTMTRVFPRMPAQQILEMATVCGAKALNLSGKIGELSPGAWADLIAVPIDAGNVDPYEAVVYAEKPITFSMVGGKETHNETK